MILIKIILIKKKRCGISNKTYDSVKLLEWGLMRLQSNLEDYEKYDVNLLSSMTLDIKHLPSTVNYKQGFQTIGGILYQKTQ